MGEDAGRCTDAVTAGATHWAEVDLVDIGADGPALRSLLEQFGLRVTSSWPRKLSSTSPSRTVNISSKSCR